MIIAVPFLIALIGLLLYLVMTNPKAAELGRIMFAIGLLVGLLRVGGSAVSLLR